MAPEVSGQEGRGQRSYILNLSQRQKKFLDNQWTIPCALHIVQPEFEKRSIPWKIKKFAAAREEMMVQSVAYLGNHQMLALALSAHPPSICHAAPREKSRCQWFLSQKRWLLWQFFTCMHHHKDCPSNSFYLTWTVSVNQSHWWWWWWSWWSWWW